MTSTTSTIKSPIGPYDSIRNGPFLVSEFDKVVSEFDLKYELKLSIVNISLEHLSSYELRKRHEYY